MARAAAERGIAISFDCNFRANLWTERGCDPKPSVAALFGMADIVFGNHRDVAMVLGEALAGATPEARRAAADAAFAAFPTLKLMASTHRDVHRSDHHGLSARIDTREDMIETEPAALDVEEK